MAQQPSFRAVRTQGPAPSERSGHSCCLLHDRVCLFGGYDGTNTLSDAFVFHLADSRWEHIGPRGNEVTNGEWPEGRASHAACLYEDCARMYVVGGSGAKFGFSNKNDVWELNLATWAWRPLFPDTAVAETSEPTEVPSQRYGHSVVLHCLNLLVWGGTHGTSYPTAMYSYSLPLKRWRMVQTSGEQPEGRYRHQAVLINGKMLVVGSSGSERYGDAHEFDIQSATWTRLEPAGAALLKEGRFAHTAATGALAPELVYVFGGNDGQRRDDLLVFDRPAAVWRQQAQTRLKRDFHAAVVHRETLYVFGGCDEDGVRRADVHACELQADALGPSTLASDLGSVLLPEAERAEGFAVHAVLLRARCPSLAAPLAAPDAHGLVQLQLPLSPAACAAFRRALYAQDAELAAREHAELVELLLFADEHWPPLAAQVYHALLLGLRAETALQLLSIAPAPRAARLVPQVQLAAKAHCLSRFAECTAHPDFERVEKSVLIELTRMHAKQEVLPEPELVPWPDTLARDLARAMPPRDAAVPPEDPELLALTLRLESGETCARCVHKTLLRARSPFFHAQLQRGVWADSAEQLYDATELFGADASTSPAVLDAFVAFLYTGSHTVDGAADTAAMGSRVAMILLECARFYQLAEPRLERACRGAITRAMNHSQVLELARDSSDFNSTSVLSMAADVIANDFSHFSQDEALYALPQSALVAVLRALGSRAQAALGEGAAKQAAEPPSLAPHGF